MAAPPSSSKYATAATPPSKTASTAARTPGLRRFPSRHFRINTVWLELALAAPDLLTWTRLLLLDGDLAAEPKKLLYWLLNVAVCLTRGSGRLRMRISATWPWRKELVTAFHRFAALHRPAG